ncbi:MAG: hypothetical protein JF603_04240 [Acidobacteria bacterium]|nr:hypothetical protein [Acidobacteriota bacterium]
MRLRWRGTDRDPVARRQEGAPAAYLDANDPCDIARHLALLDRVPRSGIVRVTVTPSDRSGSWWVEVVSSDRSGLLAAISGGLESHALDVLSASVATWPDGATLDIFHVSAEEEPHPEDLRAWIEAALGRPLMPSPVVGAVVTFTAADDGTTMCKVQAPDRLGLLHDLAATFALQGIRVASARVETAIDVAVDHFALTDRRGKPLGVATQQAVRGAILGGRRLDRGTARR